MAINASIKNLISNNGTPTTIDVDNLFYYFYGRVATPAEKSYWTKKTTGTLANALSPNARQFTNAGYYKDTVSSAPTQAEWTASGRPGVAPSFSRETTTPNPPDQASGSKRIIQEGTRIFAVDETGKRTYIKDSDELERYVFQLGYKDTRPKGSPTSSQSEQQVATDVGTDAWVDSLQNLSGEQKAALKEQLKQVDPGKKVYTDEEIAKIAADAETNATADVSPYYTQLNQSDLLDYRNKFADIRNASKRFQQQEQLSYSDLLAKTKQSLRASGLTFSGTQTKTLGDEGAIKNEAGLEGQLPQQRRFNYEDKMSGFQEAARNTGIAAERKLGSAGFEKNSEYLGNLRGYADPYGMGEGNTYTTKYNSSLTAPLYKNYKADQAEYIKYGSNELQKVKDIETSKQAKIKQSGIG
jgi:hypothetical protein